MPKLHAGSEYIIRATFVETAYRREYVEGRVYHIGIGWRVRAECCDHSDCFIYSGCTESADGYIFESYNAAVEFAEDAIGKNRITCVGNWVEYD
jgi:hypothetical protein